MRIMECSKQFLISLSVFVDIKFQDIFIGLFSNLKVRCALNTEKKNAHFTFKHDSADTLK